MELFPNWHKKHLVCHFCGETRSVKYIKEVFDEKSQPIRVHVCNKCAIRYMEDKNIHKMN